MVREYEGLWLSDDELSGQRSVEISDSTADSWNSWSLAARP